MAMSPRTILGMVLGCTSLALVILLLVCTLFIIVSYYGGITHVPTDYEQIMLDLENILQNYSIFLESML